VLRPGGLMAITDFAQPDQAMSSHALWSGWRGEQRPAGWLVDLVEAAGFVDVEQVETKFGHVAYVRGRKH